MFTQDAAVLPRSTHPEPHAEIAALPIPERMLLVIRRINPHGDPNEGPAVSEDDFAAAEETCDLTESQIKLNIGAAKRLARHAVEHPDRGDASNVMPWDIYPDYRKERVKHAGALVAAQLSDDAAIFATLRGANFDATEIGALWEEILTEAGDQVRHQRPAPMARILADLGKALDAYDQPGLNAIARQMAHSMRVALDALRDNQELPRHHLLATLNAFADALDWGAFDREHTERVRAACASLRQLWSM